MNRKKEKQMKIWVELNKLNYLIPIFKKFIEDVKNDEWINYEELGDEIFASGYFGREEVQDIFTYWGYEDDIKELKKSLEKMKVRKIYLMDEYKKC